MSGSNDVHTTGEGPRGSATAAEASPEPANPKTAGLERAVRVASVVSLVLLIGFAALYFFDRYVGGDAPSPLETSIDELEDAVREDPGNPDARLALAEMYIATERYDDALDQAGTVLEQYPDNQGALLILGVAHEASEEPEDAVGVLETFVDLRKDTEMAHVDTTLEAAYFFLGRSYLALGRASEAAEAFDSALAISPGDADAMHQAGLARQELGEHDQALEYFERATTFVPNFVEVYEAMETSYSSAGSSEQVSYAQAMQLYAAGQYEAALSELQEVTEALPEFAPGFLGLALTYEQVGDLEGGIAAGRRALEIKPDYLAAEQTLGRLLQQQGAS